MFKKLDYDFTGPTHFSEDGFSRGLYVNKKGTYDTLEVQIQDLLFIIPPELYNVEIFKWLNLRLASYTVNTLLPLKKLYKDIGEQLKKQFPELQWKPWEATHLTWPKTDSAMANIPFVINGHEVQFSPKDFLDAAIQKDTFAVKELTLKVRPWLRKKEDNTLVGSCYFQLCEVVVDF